MIRSIFSLFAIVLIFSSSANAGLLMREFAMVFGYDKPSIEACLNENSLSIADIEKVEIADVPENLYCFFQCLNRKLGYIGDDGKINVSKLEQMPWPENIPNEKKKELMECLKGLGKFETCEDMAQLHKCSSILA